MYSGLQMTNWSVEDQVEVDFGELKCQTKHLFLCTNAFAKSENAMVLTKGPEDLGAFLNQRLRWASKNGEYKNLRNVMNLVTVWFKVNIIQEHLFNSVDTHGFSRVN